MDKNRKLIKQCIKRALLQMVINQEINQRDMLSWFDPKFSQWLKTHPTGSVSQYQKGRTSQQKLRGQQQSRMFPKARDKQRQQLQKRNSQFYRDLRKKRKLRNMGESNMKQRINEMVQQFLKTQNSVGRVAGYNRPQPAKKNSLNQGDDGDYGEPIDDSLYQKQKEEKNKKSVKQGRGSDFRSGGGSEFTKPVSDSEGDPITKSKGMMQQDLTITFGNRDNMFNLDDETPQPFNNVNDRRQYMQYDDQQQQFMDQQEDQMYQAASKVLPSRNQLNAQTPSQLRNRSRPTQQRSGGNKRIDVARNWMVPQSNQPKGQMIYQGADFQEYYDLMQGYMFQSPREQIDLTTHNEPGLDPGYDVR